MSSVEELSYDPDQVFDEAMARFHEGMQKGKLIRVAAGLTELIVRELEKLDDGIERPEDVSIRLSSILDLVDEVRVDEALPKLSEVPEAIMAAAQFEESKAKAAKGTASFIFNQTDIRDL